MGFKKRKAPRLVLFGLGILLFLAISFCAGSYLLAHITYSRQVERELSLAQISGQPYRWPDLVGKTRPAGAEGRSAWDDVWPLMGTNGPAQEDAVRRFLKSQTVADEDRAVLIAVLENNEKAFEAAWRASKEPPSGPRFILEDNLPTPPRDLNHFATFSRLALLRSTLTPGTAMETTRVMLALANTLTDQPFVAAQNARAYVFNNYVWPVLKNLLRAGQTEEARALFVDHLSRIDVQSWLRLALRGQRAVGIEWFESLVQGSREIRSLIQNPDLNTWLGGFTHYPGKPWIQRDYARYLAISRNRLDSVGMPYSEWLPKMRKLGQEAHSAGGPLLAYYIDNPSLEEICETDANLAIAGYAVGMVKEIPTDPYSGQKLHVRQEGNQRFIWSVGRNGRDDSAAKDDIVWRVP